MTSSRQSAFPSSIRVECPNCRQLSPVALTYSEGSTAEYESLCEAELEGGGLCGAALMVAATRTEDIEALEDVEEE